MKIIKIDNEVIEWEIFVISLLYCSQFLDSSEFCNDEVEVKRERRDAPGNISWAEWIVEVKESEGWKNTAKIHCEIKIDYELGFS